MRVRDPGAGVGPCRSASALARRRGSAGRPAHPLLFGRDAQRLRLGPGEAVLEGDLHPFMTHLQYFKDLLALPRLRHSVVSS